MTGEITAIFIVAIVFSFISFSVYMKHKTDTLKYGMDTKNMEMLQENEQLVKKVADLDERIAVLESIVISKQYGLKEEIDSLS